MKSIVFDAIRKCIKLIVVSIADGCVTYDSFAVQVLFEDGRVDRIEGLKNGGPNFDCGDVVTQNVCEHTSFIII